jgi:hypothetical protein
VPSLGEVESAVVEQPLPEKLRENPSAVILSAAKDPRSIPWFDNLGTTAEILRCAQDDTL